MKDPWFFSSIPMWLVYEKDSEGTQAHQPYQDLVEAGTLIDPNTGDDLEIVGWTTCKPEEPTVILPNRGWVTSTSMRDELLDRVREYETIHQTVAEYSKILRDIYENRKAGDWTFEGVLGSFARDLGVL